MSSCKSDFRRKYAFTTQARTVSVFASLCQDKQTHPDSYFVKNKVCTRPTRTGRITLFNQKLIHKAEHQKLEYLIEDEEQFKQILRKHFDLLIE